MLYGNGPGFQETIRNFNLTDNQTSKKEIEMNFLFILNYFLQRGQKL